MDHENIDNKKSVKEQIHTEYQKILDE